MVESDPGTSISGVQRTAIALSWAALLLLTALGIRFWSGPGLAQFQGTAIKE